MVIENGLVLLLNVKETFIGEKHDQDRYEEHQRDKARTRYVAIHCQVSNEAQLEQQDGQLEVQQYLLEHFARRVDFFPVDC